MDPDPVGSGTLCPSQIRIRNKSESMDMIEVQFVAELLYTHFYYKKNNIQVYIPIMNT